MSNEEELNENESNISRKIKNIRELPSKIKEIDDYPKRAKSPVSHSNESDLEEDIESSERQKFQQFIQSPSLPSENISPTLERQNISQQQRITNIRAPEEVSQRDQRLKESENYIPSEQQSRNYTSAVFRSRPIDVPGERESFISATSATPIDPSLTSRGLIPTRFASPDDQFRGNNSNRTSMGPPILELPSSEEKYNQSQDQIKTERRKTELY